MPEGRTIRRSQTPATSDATPVLLPPSRVPRHYLASSIGGSEWRREGFCGRRLGETRGRNRSSSPRRLVSAPVAVHLLRSEKENSFFSFCGGPLHAFARGFRHRAEKTRSTKAVGCATCSLAASKAEGRGRCERRVKRQSSPTPVVPNRDSAPRTSNLPLCPLGGPPTPPRIVYRRL